VDCVLVDFWPKVGTENTAFFADMLYKLSCPLSEKALVETDLPFCTTSHFLLITLNVFMAFGMTCTTVTLAFIFQHGYISCICSSVFFFVLCIDMNNGAVMGCKSVTTLSSEENNRS
jgi:hypothetical protein